MNANVNPKTIFTGDNLPIMRGMNSESVLLYEKSIVKGGEVSRAVPVNADGR